MKKQFNPSEAARETLTVLASRKLAPTPENYTQVFQEILGVPATANAATSDSAPKLNVSWSALIQDLLRQLETPHKGITITRKKDGLDTVLNRFGSKPDELFEKLQGLLRSWSSAPTANLDAPPPPPAINVSNPAGATKAGSTATPAALATQTSGSGDGVLLCHPTIWGHLSLHTHYQGLCMAPLMQGSGWKQRLVTRGVLTDIDY